MITSVAPKSLETNPRGAST